MPRPGYFKVSGVAALNRRQLERQWLPRELEGYLALHRLMLHLPEDCMCIPSRYLWRREALIQDNMRQCFVLAVIKLHTFWGLILKLGLFQGKSLNIKQKHIYTFIT